MSEMSNSRSIELPTDLSEVMDENARKLDAHDKDPQPAISNNPFETHGPNKVIFAYLSSRFETFRRLTAIRDKGWLSSKGDEHFKKQRATADKNTAQAKKGFFNCMIQNGNELQVVTGGFNITRTSPPPERILDLCMAPGAFLQVALTFNPSATAKAFTLPVESGGHATRIKSHTRFGGRVDLTYQDITLMAADMGVTTIPTSHPDAASLLTVRQIPADELFDLVICDGQVLRGHDRAEWREQNEARRLVSTQLALGLEHLRESGTMIVLLHKIERWEVLKLLYHFNKFSDVSVFKPERIHASRSSFYLVAKKVQSQSEAARAVLQEWKKEWEVTTFGTAEEIEEVLRKDDEKVKEVLEEFADKLGGLGEIVWGIQANALETSKWMKK
ncbi:unnamed protein product [Zymoseptoria tritici ST99CH_3D7]|uniref:Ribosomal RNA methyltransferase FtsJ domain-containing protein n=1 Tax=Zymoseptoria tritici (strain ST99CH_3D7) TaxID=1276538 RepID=A0A1X7RPQ3_ZYMT9|nr:unnamed protein product [Zymoseptoria tritici ST99CH_3D7]